jgi:hypothetical protein
MKKKTLTEEINRMLLLMEAPANKWVMAAEGLVKVLKEIPGLSNFILNSIESLSKASNSEEVIGLLNSLAKANPKLRKDILDTVYKNLDPEVKNTVSELIEEAKDGLDAGRTMEDINKLIDDTIKTLDSKVDDIEVDLLKTIKDDVDDVVKNYEPKAPDTPTPPTPPNPKDVEALTNLITTVNQLNPGKISIKDAALLTKNFPFRKLRAETNRILNEHLMKGKYLENKIAELLKRAADELSVGDEVDPIIYKTLAAEIEAFRKTDNVLIERLYSRIESALAEGLGGTSTAQRDASEIIQKIKEHDALNPNAQTYWQYLKSDTYIGKMFSYPKGDSGMMNLLTYLKNAFLRSVSYIFTAQLRTLSELFVEFWKNKKSVPRKVLYIWGYFTAVTKIFVPIVMGAFATLWNGIKMTAPTGEKEGAFMEQWKQWLWESFQESFIVFNEQFKGEIERPDFWEGLLLFIPTLYDNREKIDPWPTIKKVANPFKNYKDEFMNAIDSLSGGYTTQKMKEFAKGIRDFWFGEVKQSTGVDLNDVEGSTDSLMQRVQDAMPAIDSIPPLRVDTTGNTRIRTRTLSPGSGQSLPGSGNN